MFHCDVILCRFFLLFNISGYNSVYIDNTGFVANYTDCRMTVALRVVMQSVPLGPISSSLC